ncbi:hypothetical protein BI037_gp55 [Morganella phage vB_MmoP_MP2]|uniref:Uncharacterized protein n=1 Tax=Morganella phage vB_MmoP_MP2 TaxID=1852627 RepID=A0A192YA47_9CAUD|nr:hypothetical protein BI037_gp55 [Morganella phage vB_MmoP_MP2]ANM46393.1 hypothetical protein MP2_gp50A [Morganella phage vB_MmoP_MP2]
MLQGVKSFTKRLLSSKLLRGFLYVSCPTVTRPLVTD